MSDDDNINPDIVRQVKRNDKLQQIALASVILSGILWACLIVFDSHINVEHKNVLSWVLAACTAGSGAWLGLLRS